MPAGKSRKTIRSCRVGELLQAAAQVFGTRDVEIYGAGRTDAGVHARGQVAHLDVPEAGRESGRKDIRDAGSAGARDVGTRDAGARLSLAPTRLAPEQILMRLNDALPHDINILSVEKVHPRFHARHDAKSRTYVYQISRRRDAFGKRFVWWVRDPLDLDAMRKAAAVLEGFHDFRSFGDVESTEQDTRVDLTRLDIRESGDRILIEITGSHFLWKMVRRIVGVLVEVGRGKMPVETVEDFLDHPSREPAKMTAPPSGLFLERVGY